MKITLTVLQVLYFRVPPLFSLLANQFKGNFSNENEDSSSNLKGFPNGRKKAIESKMTQRSSKCR